MPVRSNARCTSRARRALLVGMLGTDAGSSLLVLVLVLVVLAVLVLMMLM